MKSGDAQLNVQKNTTDNMDWKDQDIYNFYSIYHKNSTKKNI